LGKYRCQKCGYSGNDLVFQLTDYTYCVASNDEEKEYVSTSPDWVDSLGLGNAEIGEPVGCPQCHVWGTGKFDIIS